MMHLNLTLQNFSMQLICHLFHLSSLQFIILHTSIVCTGPRTFIKILLQRIFCVTRKEIPWVNKNSTNSVHMTKLPNNLIMRNATEETIFLANSTSKQFDSVFFCLTVDYRKTHFKLQLLRFFAVMVQKIQLWFKKSILVQNVQF